MKRKIQAKVTCEDIDDGIRQDPGCCPIALALKRIFLGKQIEVHLGCFRILDASGMVLGVHPLCFAATVFLIDFDDGKEVEPFEFTFEA